MSGVQVVYLGTHENATSNLAQVVIPTLTSFEKSGSFVNRGFFLQRFQQAVPGPAGSSASMSSPVTVKELTEQEEVANDLDSIWKEMGRSSTSPLKGLSFSDTKKDGIQLDGSKWAILPCRTKGSSLRAHCEAQGRLIMDFDSETLQLLGLKALFAFLMVGAVMTMVGIPSWPSERSAWMQGRVGPNRTALPFVQYIPFIGPFLKGLGIFQPLADGLKFLFKEEIVPGHVNKVYYYLAPLVALVPALTTMTVLPFGEYFDETGKSTPLILANLEVGILFIFAVSSLGVYGIVLAGWSSNSKYPFLGGIRSSAQMISYELAMGLSLLPVFLG